MDRRARPQAVRHWLFKTEPSVFSIEDLEACPKQTTGWEGVRNYQARNLLRDEIKKGDLVLFYHSSTKRRAVVGTAVVVKGPYPDPTQFDKKSDFYDPKAKKPDPRWFMVDIALQEVFFRPVTLDEMRKVDPLKDMVLLQRGSRLSIQPVTPDEWRVIVRRGEGV